MIIKICGVPHSVNIVEDPLHVAHSGKGDSLWGELSYEKHSINILASVPERELRTFLHEALHAIIQNGGVGELFTVDGEHNEKTIDQIANGYAEILESLGFMLRAPIKSKKIRS